MLNGVRFWDLSGLWQVRLRDGSLYNAALPGTLDENGIGGPDREQIDSRLTRLHVYVGPAAFTRTAVLSCVPGNRLFLLAERARVTNLLVDGMPVPVRTGTVSTPWTFELTAWADGRAHALTLISDNGYPGCPRDEILNSSAATDETQTNWNGILGRLEIIEQSPVFVGGLRLLCGEGGAKISVTVDAGQRWKGDIFISSPALSSELHYSADVAAGRTALTIPAGIAPAFPRWDELESHLSTITAEIPGMGKWTERCGVRVFAVNGEKRLTLNGRVFFLRGEANCCVFPETGHAPMTTVQWREVLRTYANYGVNCMRFHSHCPPEAAFAAADELGMLMQPELSHWDPNHALESMASYQTYRNELLEIMLAYGHHPSFVMLSLGNELHAHDEAQGIKRMHELVRAAHQMDDTRLIAWGSNNFYGERLPEGDCDFYTSMACGKQMLRCTSPRMEGRINHTPPGTDYTFDEGIDELRKGYQGPVFGFEVGQYEVLPDFDEIDDFRGVTRAVNYQIVREQVSERGMLDTWKRQVEATGEMSLACYREEVEAVLRTERMSGLSLLGLQDFPGQGTALVGMLNAHLRPKPYGFAAPGRFRAFFRDVLPLACLPSRTFTNTDSLNVMLALANYGKADASGAMRWQLQGSGKTLTGETENILWKQGCLTKARPIEIPLNAWTEPTELTLTLALGEHANDYCLWVYPDVTVQKPDTVTVTADVREALSALEKGGRVLLTPKAEKESIPRSIGSTYTPDFWSVGSFPDQEGAMGCLIETEHPIFRRFPTRGYTTWQWWRMASGRAFFVPRRFRPVVRVMDCFKRLRSMALLCECKVGKGRLMFSGMGLMEAQEHIEVRALTDAILRYMDSDAFLPTDEMTPEELRFIFTPDAKKEEA